MSNSGNRQTGNNRGRQGGGLAALALLCIILMVLLGYYFSRQHPKMARSTASISANQLPAKSSPSDQAETPLILPRPESYPSKDTQNYIRIPPATSSTRPEKQMPGKGRLAIIIDDMGSRVEEAQALYAIGVPLTFSIIPGLRSYREVASFAASKGTEIMIHIPMQSKGWPQQRIEANGLLLSMDDAAVTSRLDEFFRQLPEAVGANNHMGSEYSEHVNSMKLVLNTLKAKNLFFVDSVTTPKSTGFKLAREMGVRTERRNVFLDNEQNRDYIEGQLEQAVHIAERRGQAIAIGHPHPSTINTLAELLPVLERQGITLVPVSQLVR
jgi:polysaccharide deacetylase 2 family uncharacterized protein YibQ